MGAERVGNEARLLEARIRTLELWQAQHETEYANAMDHFTEFKDTVERHQAELINGLAALKFRVTIMVIVAVVLVLGANAGLAEMVKMLLR